MNTPTHQKRYRYVLRCTECGKACSDLEMLKIHQRIFCKANKQQEELNLSYQKI